MNYTREMVEAITNNTETPFGHYRLAEDWLAMADKIAELEAAEDWEPTDEQLGRAIKEYAVSPALTGVINHLGSQVDKQAKRIDKLRELSDCPSDCDLETHLSKIAASHRRECEARQSDEGDARYYEMANRIAELEAINHTLGGKVRTLRKALKPFADASPPRDYRPQGYNYMKTEYWRAAAAVMESTGGEDENNDICYVRAELVKNSLLKIDALQAELQSKADECDGWFNNLAKLQGELTAKADECEELKRDKEDRDAYLRSIREIVECPNGVSAVGHIRKLQTELDARKQSEPVEHRVLDMIAQNLESNSIHFSRRRKHIVITDSQKGEQFAITIHTIEQPPEPAAEKPWCYWQVKCEEDKAPNTWTCTAHLNEGRALSCRFRSMEDAKSAMFVCQDAEPPKVEAEEPERPDGVPDDHSWWYENNGLHHAPTVDGSQYGNHDYGPTEMGECKCGCWMGQARSGGPTDPFGPCLMNRKHDAAEEPVDHRVLDDNQRLARTGEHVSKSAESPGEEIHDEEEPVKLVWVERASINHNTYWYASSSPLLTGRYELHQTLRRNKMYWRERSCEQKYPTLPEAQAAVQAKHNRLVAAEKGGG